MPAQLSLWDAPIQIKPVSQVELVRAADGGYDVKHRLSGLLVCSFRPVFVTKALAQMYCDMLSDVDLDAWYLAGRPHTVEALTPFRTVMVEWRAKAFPGVFVNMNDVQRRYP